MFVRDIRQLAREAALVGGWLAVLLILLSLLTYAPQDPAWSTAGSSTPETIIQNSLGVVGAYIADVLFSAFGYSAYLLCIAAFIALHTLFRGDTFDNAGRERLGAHWCAFGLLCFIVASSALEYVHFFDAIGREALPSEAGGGVGEVAGGGLQKLLGVVGASLLLLGIWMISLSLAAALSWFSFFEIIGERCERLLDIIGGSAVRQVAIWRAMRAQKAKEKREQAEEPPTPTTPTAEFIMPSTSKLMSRKAPRKPMRPPTLNLTATPTEFTTDSKIKETKEVKEIKESTTTNAEEESTLPPSSLLDVYTPENTVTAETEAFLAHNSALIEQTLKSFGVSVRVLSAHPGPVITRYDIQPDVGVKGAQIVSLMRDMARALSVTSIRVLETIPGKNCMGLEIPNTNRATVYLSEIIADDAYRNGKQTLPLALGKDATGEPVVVDLATMPHLLAAGATGSGKSVCLNAMLLSLLYAAPPSLLKMILIDPKMLELASYEGIPHLLAPVVTDVTLAPAALNWTVGEMESRYRMMSETGARNIASYNRQLPEGQPPLPYIVVVIDELADLMMSTGKKVEMTISRLAQKARAAGIHLILATQRPSVDVITGLIKANVPCRIAFQVAAKVDSRTIIDQMGADLLLGMGDMLYLPPGVSVPRRVHGAFVSDDEVLRVSKHLRGGRSAEYAVDFSEVRTPTHGGSGGNADNADALYEQAVEAVMSANRPSISFVQRKLRIGYNRAARLIEDMEAAGIVSSADESGIRKILQAREIEEE